MNARSAMIVNAIATFSKADSDAPDQAARFLKSLGHRDRLKVLCALVEGELAVADIESKVGASQSAISQHLGRLKDDGIVTSRRDGRRVLYSISDQTVFEVLQALYKRFCA